MPQYEDQRTVVVASQGRILRRLPGTKVHVEAQLRAVLCDEKHQQNLAHKKQKTDTIKNYTKGK